MAKKSVIARNKRREQLVARYAERRAELKRRARDPSATQQQRWEAQEQLQRHPRDASPVRVRRRCHFSGRGNACYRKFGLARNRLREAAMQGDIPGLVKASW